MKNLIFLFIIIDSINLNSQKLDLGLSSSINGLNYNNKSKNITLKSYEIGFSSGLNLKYHFNKKISIRQEINYEYSFSKFEYNNGSYNSTNKLSIQFLKIPTIIQYDFYKKIGFLFGISNNILLDSKISSEYNPPQIIIGANNNSYNKYLNNYQVSGLIGFSLEKKINSKYYFQGNLIFEKNISKISKSEFIDLEGDLSYNAIKLNLIFYRQIK